MMWLLCSFYVVYGAFWSAVILYVLKRVPKLDRKHFLVGLFVTVALAVTASLAVTVRLSDAL